MSTRRTTLAADSDDLALLENEARRRDVPLTRILREAVERAADELRRERKPHFGIARTPTGAARAAARDENAPIRERSGT
jgi:hypothetical protein